MYICTCVGGVHVLFLGLTPGLATGLARGLAFTCNCLGQTAICGPGSGAYILGEGTGRLARCVCTSMYICMYGVWSVFVCIVDWRLACSVPILEDAPLRAACGGNQNGLRGTEGGYGMI